MPVFKLSKTLKFDYDAYAHRAQNILISANPHLMEDPMTSPGPVFPTPQSFVGRSPFAFGPNISVGILGAGPGGLYTALILEDLGIPYHIIEARGRVGGRLYTHEFENPTGAPYNYYDAGAMRFPNISAMRRIFNLFNYAPLNTGGQFDLASRLRPFIYTEANGNALLSFNGITVKQSDAHTTTFDASAVIHDISPDDAASYIAVGPDAILNDVIAPYATGILQDLDTGRNDGWKALMQVDNYSMRGYMSTVYRPSDALPDLPDTPLSNDVINWCETFDASTGGFDRAFSETVLDAVAFGWNPNGQSTDWSCVDGGSYQIARVMADYIRSKNPNAIELNTRVTCIAMGQDGGMEVTAVRVHDQPGAPQVYKFSHVISTLPLPVLRIIDLNNAGLNSMQTNALRDLTYGAATKIGMQFQTAWWYSGTDNNGNKLNIVGGQTYTDTPLRTVVYPSFGDPQTGSTTTLIAAYDRVDDASRIGALMGTPEDIAVLKKVVIRELARIHNVDESFLWGQLLEFHAWNWQADPHTMGAFAFYGPGKFQNPYLSLTAPAAGGLLHFAGEALSTRHAWVEGALDSAWRAAFGLLFSPGFIENLWQDWILLITLISHWGYNSEWAELRTPKSVQADKRRRPGEEEKVVLEKTLLFRHLLWSRAKLEKAERAKLSGRRLK